ncbi:hypothetical protein B0O80DRAFT_498665 [Mortierella sp. GBAus27b]|nr:hypothetical protein BGX31_001558 [Mortierella sp. GBA43]KAI8353815.1 hypothetical protein B0O80DRAFT_498665 [Mortierella sp. GBAus27b]
MKDRGNQYGTLNTNYIKTAFEYWMEKGRRYNYDKPGYLSDNGAFTQIIWKDTTQVGCAYQ